MDIAAITSLNDIQDRVGKWHQAVFIQKVSQPCSTYVGFNMIARLNISGGISNEKLRRMTRYLPEPRYEDTKRITERRQRIAN